MRPGWYRLGWPAIMLLLGGIVLAACGPASAGREQRPVGGDSRPIGPGSEAATPARSGVRVELAGWSDAAFRLARPIAVAVDRQGQLYVVDAGHQRLVVFDRDGRFLTTWGGPGGDEGQFRFFGAVPCDDAGGAYACLPDVGGGVAVDAEDRVYVADWGNHRVQAFDGRGRLLARWGRRGDGPGEFWLPSAIAVDEQGHVYVSDAGNRRVQQFDRAGAFLGQWAGGGAPEGRPFYPGSLAVDGHGRVSVLDPVNGRVEQFDGQGRSLARWEVDALRDGEVRHVAGLAVDRRGDVYVAGTDDRVHQLDPAGQVVLRWDRGWRGEARLLRPAGLAVDDQGQVYVADQSRDRIPTFRLAPPVTR